MEPNEINEESPVDQYVEEEQQKEVQEPKKVEELPEYVKIAGMIEKQFDLVQLELLKQIREVLKEKQLDYEKLGALVDTYEVILGSQEE